MSVVLISGATRGIGLATARQLQAAGHTVWVGARDEQAGRAVAASFGAEAVALDVTDDASVTAAIERITKDGDGLDVLINNAGIGVAETTRLSGATALQEFDTNVVGAIRLTEAALPLLRKSAGGVVVNLGSGLGSFASTTDENAPQRSFGGTYLVYASTKAALGMLSLQYSMREKSVSFVAVEPGFTATGLTGHAEGAQTAEAAAEVVARWAVTADASTSGTFQGGHGVWPW